MWTELCQGGGVVGNLARLLGNSVGLGVAEALPRYRIAVALGVDGAMPFPQQLQRHPWPAQLAVDHPAQSGCGRRCLAASAGGG
jgi:hypothetical protein